MNIVRDNWLNVVSQSEKEARIKIHGVIGGGFFEEGVTDEQVEADLEEIKNLKANKIVVDLSSLGGSVKHGMKIYNLLKQNPANIEIDITGWCASMGTVIAMAGDKIKMVDNNHFLVHEARTISYGTKSQLESDAKFIDNINNDIAKIYSKRVGISIEEAKSMMAVNGGEGEFWNAEETLSKGFIDELYSPENNRAAASISKEKLQEFKINAKLKTNTMKLNKKSIGDFVAKAYTKVMAAFSDEEKQSEENIQVAIEASVEAVANELQKEVDAWKEEQEGKYSALETEKNQLQGKYDKLVAGGSEEPGADADLEGDNKVLTQAQKIAKEVTSQMTDTDRQLMTIKEN